MIRSALSSIHCPMQRLIIAIRARILTIIPTDTFDQFDARIYSQAHENCHKYDTDDIAYRLLVSRADRIDKIAGHTWWWQSRWY